MNNEELLDVYGEDGMETGEVLTKSEIHRQGILHRIAQVWLFDGKSSLMLQKRALSKKLDPGMWAVLGGHVGTQEESRIAAVREVQEEMGIELDPEFILYLGTVRYTAHVADDFIENELVDVYVVQTDVDASEVRLNDESSEAKYFTIIDLENQYASENPQFAYRPESFSLIREYIYGPGQN
jgi:isopentenyl-diphosphate delta-isomerase